MDNIVSDLNNLQKAAFASIKNSSWKTRVQEFEMGWLPNIVKAKEKLESRTYESDPTTEFTLCERGKVRPITSLTAYDRAIRHSLCDNVLTPSLLPYLIYDNGASLPGRGISFTRKRFEEHMHSFYRKHGNCGYVLLMDYSKFYDNIDHEIAYTEIIEHVKDDMSRWLLRKIFDDFRVDVSGLPDKVIAQYRDGVFDAKEYRLRQPNSSRTGEKFLRKSVNIGDQCSQIIGVYYPTRIDNYIKIVKGIKYYGRYMDDSYIIASDKEFLVNTLAEIKKIAAELGITVNNKKTKIVKLSDYFKFLQITYSLTDSGKLIRKINTRRVVDMRQKLKSLKAMCDAGERKKADVESMFISWMCDHASYMSRIQRDSLNTLYVELFGGFINERYTYYYTGRRIYDPSRVKWKQLYN